MSAPGGDRSFDCIVVGAGHNGLVCAAKLARAGRKVLVLEASEHLGGAARTREFFSGFRVSAGAHLLHLMPRDLLAELELESNGLRWSASGMPTTALVAQGTALRIHGTLSGGDVAPADAAAYGAYRTRMARFAAALAPILARVPPRLGVDDWSDRWELLRTGWQLRKLGRRDLRELLRIGGMNVFDLLEEQFESPALKGALAFDAVLGSNFGPRSPGTVLTLLYRLAGESSTGGTGLAQPAGGMGAVCAAIAGSAMAAGATVMTGTEVASIVVKADRAAGVTLTSGEQFLARAIVSSADPKTTFLGLVGSRHLDTGFVRRISHLRSCGVAAKLHLALSETPNFTGVDATGLRGRLLIAPTQQHLERAYNHCKYGEYSADPAMEITVPTMNDDGLAPAGRHVLSAIVQYAPYALKDGWTGRREAFQEIVIDTLERHAPGLRASILGAELLTPLDMEREFRISGGHWHHADLAFDQFMMVRPVPGATQHRTPLAGLYLCGAGCHPGGGVMGIAGRNAAAQILKQAA